jgi:hypothetical protein
LGLLSELSTTYHPTCTLLLDSQKGKVDLFKLSLILPQEVKDLIMQVLVWSEEKKEMVEEDLVEIGEEALIVLNTSSMPQREAELAKKFYDDYFITSKILVCFDTYINC